MSTTTAPQWELDVSGTATVPFSRLVRVELRKMLDTRGGFWLLLLTGLLLTLVAVIVLIVVATTDGEWAPSLMTWSTEILLVPLSVLLPVFPILAVTSEWGQRTGLTTFTLESNRLKVLGAKLVAVLALAVGTSVLAVLLALVGTPLGAALDGSSPVWEVDWAVVGGTLVSQLLFFLMAFALASAILSTPGAISVFYVMGLMVPFLVYSTLMFAFEWGPKVIPYFDLTFASTPLMGGEAMTGREAAQLASAVLIWIVAPLAFGVRRLLRAEIK
ncbi:MAG: ABC transporter permease [Nocardioides sp.]|uniref:ABC transporter permease n=1 Tax=Nocardioides sp. TaxID=35761 RepID=UPI003F0B4286